MLALIFIMILSATSVLSHPVHAPADVTHQSEDFARGRESSSNLQLRNADFDVLQPRAGKTANNGIRIVKSAGINWKTWRGQGAAAVASQQSKINLAKSQLTSAEAQMRQMKSNVNTNFAKTEKSNSKAWAR
jgi:uncharacterized protein YukE